MRIMYGRGLDNYQRHFGVYIEVSYTLNLLGI